MVARRHLPHLPKQVLRADITYDDQGIGWLVSAENRIKIIEQLSSLKKADTKHHVDPLSKYSVIKSTLNGKTKFYAIYIGQGNHEAAEPPPRLLGNTPKAKIKLAQDLETGEWVALKIVQHSPGETLTTFTSYATNEYATLIMLNQAKGMYHYEKKKTKRNAIAFLTDYAGRLDLFDFKLSFRTKTISALQTINIMINTIDAVITFHNKTNKVHGDIKLENLMIDPSTCKVNLVDFELSKAHIDPATGTHLSIDEEFTPQNGLIQGSLSTLAPETYEHAKYSRQSDIYSTGRVLAIFLGLVQFPYGDMVDSPNDMPLYDAYSADLILSSRFTDRSARTAIFKLIHEMANPESGSNPKSRPSLTEAKARLITIRENLADYVSDLKTIAYLNVDDYDKANADIKRYMIEAARKFNRVVFIDTIPDRSMRTYVDLKNACEKTPGAAVVTDIFIAEDPHDAVKEAAQTLNPNSSDKISCTEYYITANTTNATITNIRQMMTEATNSELLQMTPKH